MTGKETAKATNEVTNEINGISEGSSDRGKKIMNSIANVSIILMSTMMGAFTEIMKNATSAMASGMAEAMGGKEAGGKVDKDLAQKLPEIDEKMKTLISDVRKDLYDQIEQKSGETEPLLSDPAFDVGPKIIDKYDFKLPKFTERLDDTALAQYMQLLMGEDPSFAEMFKELASWLNTLPKLPERTNEK